MNHYVITEICKISEREASEMAVLKKEIEGHQVSLCNLGVPLGYSPLVFLRGKHQCYANEYESHHGCKDEKEPMERYETSLGHKLNEEYAFAKEVEDYAQGRGKKSYFCCYRPLQLDRESAVLTAPMEEKRARHRKKISSRNYDPVGFCYFYNPAIVDRHKERYDQLVFSKRETSKSYPFMKNAFRKDMATHEYVYSYDDHAILYAFGGVSWDESLDECFASLKFTEKQKKAYADARREYLTAQSC